MFRVLGQGFRVEALVSLTHSKNRTLFVIGPYPSLSTSTKNRSGPQSFRDLIGTLKREPKEYGRTIGM